MEGIPPSDGKARQHIIKDLYGRFFKRAFPNVAEFLGIVYTPIEVVDFMIRATQAALYQHFDKASLTDPGIHILDPFTGTGTFITRLLQSGYIEPEDLDRKYNEEIHANEFLLLAYYIAAVNIETTYNELAVVDDTDRTYKPFPGIVLTDTFQLGEDGEGHQVWNRQRRQESLINVNDVALGHETRMKWNDRNDWVWSTEPSHQALITREQWAAAQTRLEANRRIATRRPKTGRRYLLAGRIRCGSCGRRMEGSWNHDNPYYRCQIHRGDPNDSKNHPSTIYVKEEILLPGLDG